VHCTVSSVEAFGAVGQALGFGVVALAGAGACTSLGEQHIIRRQQAANLFLNSSKRSTTAAFKLPSDTAIQQPSFSSLRTPSHPALIIHSLQQQRCLPCAPYCPWLEPQARKEGLFPAPQKPYTLTPWPQTLFPPPQPCTLTPFCPNRCPWMLRTFAMRRSRCCAA